MSLTVKRITAVLVVDAVEPSLAFWQTTLGFTKLADVPHGDVLGFAMLERDGYEVMLQSVASAKDDLPAGLATPPGTAAALFIEVSDLALIEHALGSYPLAMPRRKTFYGMHEIGVVEPGGHFVIFAQPE